ncbi:hypothetical protein [uncultured Paraglaciecola sp.]|uniref:hypothetical protein n=1 Tax=uncultured Paraglaciecola sp. TaxID=1765024 RepID=UPI0030DC6646|tara:strand:- start:158406 stop:160157 length:1752 start_codon:yes stop_codon:yes gene_type:complete
MPEKIVKQHYIALVKLLKIYRTAPLDRDLLQATLHFCKNLYGAAKAHPDLLFAQPQLYKSQLPFIVNLSFNSVVITCLLAERNKFDPSVTIQLMCGSLSICGLEQSSIEKHYQTVADNQKPTTTKIGQHNATFVHLLKTSRQQVWLSSYLLGPHIHLSRYPQESLTSPLSALTYMANKFALLCTTNKQKQSISFANAIKHLSLICCHKWYVLLMPLVDYPSVSPPGSYIRLRDNSVHMVLSLNNKGLVTKALSNKQTIGMQSSETDIQVITTDQVTKIYPCQQLNGFARLNHWWGTELNQWLSSHQEHAPKVAFNLIQSIKTAPASLMVIQDQLNHVNADIAVIIKAIEKEPLHAHQLLVSASSMNRNKQPVRSIQHGLAMLGFERSNSILLQYSLLARLNQQYFPLQQALLTFNQFFVNIVAELATRTKLLSSEFASTTAYFAVSRLFTLPTIRSLKRWETTTIPRFKLASLIKAKESQRLKHDGFMLAKTWHQNKQMLEVLRDYDLVSPEQQKTSSTSQYCYVLGIGLILAQEHYFLRTGHCEETEGYLKTGLHELGLSPATLTSMMTEVVARTNVFCQLD